MSPHNAACRWRMGHAIRTADPDRWARYLLRKGQEEAVEEEEEAESRRSSPAVPPAVEDGEVKPQVDDDDGWGSLFEDLGNDEQDIPHEGVPSAGAFLERPELQASPGPSESAGSPGAPMDPGAAAEQSPPGRSNDLVHIVQRGRHRGVLATSRGQGGHEVRREGGGRHGSHHRVGLQSEGGQGES